MPNSTPPSDATVVQFCHSLCWPVWSPTKRQRVRIAFISSPPLLSPDPLAATDSSISPRQDTAKQVICAESIPRHVTPRTFVTSTLLFSSTTNASPRTASTAPPILTFTLPYQTCASDHQQPLPAPHPTLFSPRLHWPPSCTPCLSPGARSPPRVPCRIPSPGHTAAYNCRPRRP